MNALRNYVPRLRIITAAAIEITLSCSINWANRGATLRLVLTPVRKDIHEVACTALQTALENYTAGGRVTLPTTLA